MDRLAQEHMLKAIEQQNRAIKWLIAVNCMQIASLLGLIVAVFTS